jgi:hypothetical protein
MYHRLVRAPRRLRLFHRRQLDGPFEFANGIMKDVVGEFKTEPKVAEAQVGVSPGYRLSSDSE